jgi:hypothetical protein
MRIALLAVLVAACGGPAGADDEADAAPGPDGPPVPVYTPGDPIVIGDGAGNDEDPAVLVAADGSLYVTWFSESEGFDIVISRSTDGQTWSPPVHISSGSARDFGPTLYQDVTGRIHAVWFRWDSGAPPGHLMHDASAPGDGLAWSTADENEVTTVGAWDDWVPSIAADDSGQMHVAFARNTCPPPDECYGIYTTSSATGAVWSDPVPVVQADATTEHHLPSIAYLDGELWLAWDPFDRAANTPFDNSSTGSHISIMRYDTGTWVDRGDITARDDNEVSLFPHLFAAHGGAPHLLWLSAGPIAATNVEKGLAELDTEPRPLPSLAGYSARLVATPTADVYLAAWVQGPDGEREVAIQLMTLP